MSISLPLKRRSGDSGYSLLMVVFLVATSLILSAAVAPNLLTQGRREREDEMVWRGEQYERAIGLYFRKFGRYPTKVDDLVKQTNGVRFLRKAYTDPMNKEDGSWRFIYVGPNGQLIGSLRSPTLVQNALSMLGTPGASPMGAGPQPPAATGATPTIASGTPGIGQSNPQAGSATTPNPLQAQPQSLTGQVIGGNIIGVGSKIKQSSLRVYEGGDTYQKWEFIYNPMQLGGNPGQAVPANPVAAPAAPGQQPQAAPGQDQQQNPPGTQPQQPAPQQPPGTNAPVSPPA